MKTYKYSLSQDYNTPAASNYQQRQQQKKPKSPTHPIATSQRKSHLFSRENPSPIPSESPSPDPFLPRPLTSPSPAPPPHLQVIREKNTTPQTPFSFLLLGRSQRRPAGSGGNTCFSSWEIFLYLLFLFQPWHGSFREPTL